MACHLFDKNKFYIMKKIFVPVILIFLIICLQSCNNSGGDKETTATTDSIRNNSAVAVDSNSLDTNNKMNADSMNKTSQSSTVDKDAQDFALKAASGGAMEVELGKFAQQNGMSQGIKDFGKMMVEDHTKAGNELKGIAVSKNMTIPADMMEEHKKHVDELSKKTGADFDKAYISMMIDDHKEDISDFKKASSNLKDADLKAFAGKTLPVLQKHLAAVEKLKK